MTSGGSMLSNLSFRIRDRIRTTAGTGDTFRVTNDLEQGTAFTVYQASIVLINKSGLERFELDIVNGVATIIKRGLDQSEFKTESSALKKEWSPGTLGYITNLASDLLDIDNGGYGANIYTDINFYGRNKHFDLSSLPSYTTTERNLLTNVTNGTLIYNTTDGVINQYITGNWTDTSSGTTVFASTNQAGKVEEADMTEIAAQTETGSTGARLFINPKWLKKTSDGSADENKIPILDSTGKLSSGFINAVTFALSGLTALATPSDIDQLMIYREGAFVNQKTTLAQFKSTISMIGGDGSNGGIGGALTITGSDNTYIVKNYTSFAPGSTTVTVTPINCVVHIKVSGNCDLTSTTFNFSGKGGEGGTAGSGNGGVGNGSIFNISSGIGGAGGSGGAGGIGGISYGTRIMNIGGKALSVGCGSGGGGGGTSTGLGGTGGAGGGTLILEVKGSLTLNGTTFNFAGGNGTVGANSGGGAGGGGGGGGGGSLILIYKGTLTDTSKTINVTGGTGAAGGTGGGTGTNGGGGGGGGGSLVGNGLIGGTSSTINGGAGGNGHAGNYLLVKNTISI